MHVLLSPGMKPSDLELSIRGYVFVQIEAEGPTFLTCASRINSLLFCCTCTSVVLIIHLYWIFLLGF